MDKLLNISAKYEGLVLEMLRHPLYEDSARYRLCRTMCSVAIEHAQSAKMLLTAGNFTSSVGLLRLQFEAFVRAIWFFHVSSESAVEKFSLDLTAEIANRNEKIPMLSEMLKQMEGKVQESTLKPIIEFRDHSWKPLSSYVHGGIHTIDRHSKGYPVALLEQSLKASNGLNGMTGYFLAQLTGKKDLFDQFHKSFVEFSDCLPDTKRKSI